MIETGFVKCYEMRAPGQGPRSWYLVRTDALFAESEWSWTAERGLATRLPGPAAEEWTTRAGRMALPLLPTSPTPLVPMFVQVVYGSDAPDPQPSVLERAECGDEVQPKKPSMRGDIPERIAAARNQRNVMKQRRPVSECDALSRWEAEHEA